MNRLYTEDEKGGRLICVLEPGNIHKLVDLHMPIDFSLNEGPYEKALPAKLSLTIAYSETPIGDSREFAKTLAPGGAAVDKRTRVVNEMRPHCPQCRSTIEQLGIARNDGPVWIAFCPMCGCTLGAFPRIASWPA